MTKSEENYLKAIYHLSINYPSGVSTTSLASAMESKPSSITDMIQKMAEKDLVIYKKYQGVQLTTQGRKAAIQIIRKHRLWEVFLVDKLEFTWDEVHDIAEQLEHIQSEELTNKLEKFLGFPIEDPHGDPIPNSLGEIPKLKRQILAEAPIGLELICVGVKDSSPNFLQYLDKQKIALGTKITIIEKESFDHSLKIKLNNDQLMISQIVANNIFVKST